MLTLSSQEHLSLSFLLAPRIETEDWLRKHDIIEHVSQVIMKMSALF